MSTWDVFHSDRLEVERGLSAEQVRAKVARGELRAEDLARPAGTQVAWSHLSDLPALWGPPAGAAASASGAADSSLIAPPTPDPDAGEEPIFTALIEEEEEEDEGRSRPDDEAPRGAILTAEFADEDEEDQDIGPRRTERLGQVLGEVPSGSTPPRLATRDDPPFDEPVADLHLETAEVDEDEDEHEEEYDPEEEDEAAAEFTLSRGAPPKVEELDLAAMVDVAFQMVLFFMVTATTVLYKTLEVPRPSPEKAPGAVAQGQGRSLDDLQNDYILVEIDPQGRIQVDHEPAPTEMAALAERLRAARTQTGRTAMLLTADFTTPHK
ncbi:MAG: biopolymer transporter ExbD, partial [Isosphaeraceae bacterium]|nr:biopolymer transporter ExbD [Isosphaeraceae bacterium]